MSRSNARALRGACTREGAVARFRDGVPLILIQILILSAPIPRLLLLPLILLSLIH